MPKPTAARTTKRDAGARAKSSRTSVVATRVTALAAGPVAGWPKWESHFARIPFDRGTVDAEYNRYSGLYRDTLRRFSSVSGGPRAVTYATKFTVDGDGSGGAQPGDEDPRPDTSLHYHDKPNWSQATALNALRTSFAVIPGENASRPTFAALGIGLGDIGIAFFGRGKAAAFIYGDIGPVTKVGEGSITMAKLLGMDWPPFMNSSAATGGFTVSEMATFAPGVVHVAFPGSRDRPDKMTDLLTQSQLDTAAWGLFDRWMASFGA